MVIRRVLNGFWGRVPPRLARTVLTVLDRLGREYVVPGELQSCPACRAADIEHLRPLPLYGWKGGRRVGFVTGCRRCGIVFANPMPTAETLAEMYSPAGRWGQLHGDDAHQGRPSSRNLARILAPVQADLDITRPLPGSSVLDFGCGSGKILNGLQAIGWTTYGIDASVKTAFPRHLELQTIPTTPSFEFAVAHHVLEHVSNPLDVLRALFACLKARGVLFVSVPRMDAIAWHLDYRYCINNRTHIVGYTRDAMATLMGMAGFHAIDLNPPLGSEGGDPKAIRRLRMIGQKAGAPTTHPEPLAAAKQALERWQAATGSEQSSLGSSVRAAAALRNFERQRHH